MAKLNKNEAGAYVAPADSSLVDDLMGGIQAPFLGSDSAIDSKSARYGVLLYTIGGVALGSIIARKRAASGAEPVLKVFF